MSRDSQWTVITHALRHSWTWPADEAEITDLSNRVASWTDLTHLVTTIEQFQRDTPDKRPSINQLTANAARRRRLANATGHPNGACPTCNSHGFIPGPTHHNTTTLKPCPTCRPGTANMHHTGLYTADTPTHTDSYEAAGIRARTANDNAPRYAPSPVTVGFDDPDTAHAGLGLARLSVVASPDTSDDLAHCEQQLASAHNPIDIEYWTRAARRRAAVPPGDDAA